MALAVTPAVPPDQQMGGGLLFLPSLTLNLYLSLNLFTF